MNDAVIVDVDGTLALMQGRRSPFAWDEVMQDDPNLPIIKLVNILRDSGLEIIITTGRDGIALNDTKAWLTSHGVVYDAIFIRDVDDFRKDSIVKQEIYDNQIKDNWNIQYVVDDRNQVVSMWRDLGLTVLQVANGDF
tara:strand:+ start:18234 stop:18647 length:414 start_codon:yes stop_codon:yes gene_type:complete